MITKAWLRWPVWKKQSSLEGFLLRGKTKWFTSSGFHIHQKSQTKMRRLWRQWINLLRRKNTSYKWLQSSISDGCGLSVWVQSRTWLLWAGRIQGSGIETISRDIAAWHGKFELGIQAHGSTWKIILDYSPVIHISIPSWQLRHFNNIWNFIEVGLSAIGKKIFPPYLARNSLPPPPYSLIRH